MDASNHSMIDLFDQLGLPSTTDDIAHFIGQHRPLPDEIKLADASFWSKGQAQFLREEIAEDANWAEVVDQLNVALRA